MNKSDGIKTKTSWNIRVGNVFANTGLWFVLPYAGTALASIPSVEAAGFSMLIGFVISATREWFDHVREQSA